VRKPGRRRTAAQDPQDLGFGTVVANQTRRRLLNRDGSFNVVRRGGPWQTSLSLYQALLEMSWPRFLAWVGGLYTLLNALFACGYVALGPGTLVGGDEVAAHGEFWRAFFFSVESLSTVGYGHIVPQSVGAHVLMTLECVAGLLAVALVTGIAFARFSRPQARVLWSDQALIAPYRDGWALMFRIANARSNQLIEVTAQVTLGYLVTLPDGTRQRRFEPLSLERSKVNFFTLSWTLVHPIDAASPLAGMSAEDLAGAEIELFILLTAIDDTFAQTVHTRSSYAAGELVWGGRFSSLFVTDTPDDRPTIDLDRLSAFEKIEGPARLPVEPSSGALEAAGGQG
jgi:inward rectifier potassium channel